MESTLMIAVKRLTRKNIR